MISYSYIIEIILVPVLGWAGDSYVKYRTRMLLIHVITFSGFIALVTFHPNCPKDMPCYNVAYAGLILNGISFAFF